jgi:hypothetical protein
MIVFVEVVLLSPVLQQGSFVGGGFGLLVASCG